MTQVLPDQSARNSAIDINHSILIQAPAGSGKTELLIQRYLNALSHCQTGPEEVLALTFTKKAASEMKSRIHQALLKANDPDIKPHQQKTNQLAQAVLRQDSKHHWQLLKYPQRMQIKTIDALCAHITNKHGTNQPSDPHPTPFLIYTLAAKNIVFDLMQQNNPAVNELLLYFHNRRESLIELLATMLSHRDQWLPIIGINHPSALINMCNQYLNNHCTETTQQALDAIFNHTHDDLLEQLRWAASQLPILNNIDCEHIFDEELNNQMIFCQNIANMILRNDLSIRKTVTIKQGFPSKSQARNPAEKEEYTRHKKLMIEQLEQLDTSCQLITSLQSMSRCPSPSYPEHLSTMIASLNHILPRLVAYLQHAFKSLQTTDFIQISMDATAALSTNQSIPSESPIHLDYKLSHLLIDEFQDTSLQQLDLIARLTQGWLENDKTSIFIVGDPMQSIYRFRQAEVGLFYQVQRQGIGKIKFKTLKLLCNFRSQAAIVNWNNIVFNNVFPSALQTNIGAIPFAPATAMINSEHDPICCWYQQDNHAQFHFIADVCKRILSKDPSATIAILARSRSIINPIFNIFNQYNLCFQGFGLDPLLESLDVQELYNLSAFIEKPHDNLLCATLLRSRLIGLSNDDLYQICNLSRNKTLWEHINHLPNLTSIVQHPTRIAMVVSLLVNALKQRKTASLRQTIFDFWINATPMAYYNNVQQQPIWLFLESLQKAEQHSPANPLLLLLKILNNQYLSGPEQNIKIMTIHKSKGLEFDHVFIPGLGASVPPRSQKLLWWDHLEHPNGAHDDIFLPNHQPGTKPSKLHTYLYQKEQSKTTNELIRLLYVAGTRAKTQVYWSGTVNENNAPHPRSPLALIWQGLGSEQKEIMLPDSNVENQLNKEQFITKFSQPIQEINLTPYLDDASIPQQSSFVNNSLESTYSFEAALGQAVHYLMQFLATHPPAEKINCRTLLTSHCLELGVQADDIKKIIQIIQAKLNCILTHPQATWILKKRSSTQTEHSIYAKNGNISILDICFYDSNNFWIIDYKTHYSEYQHNEETLKNHHFKEYYDQLYHYYTILKANGIKQIRCGLYFPLSGTWHEIPVTEQTAAYHN